MVGFACTMVRADMTIMITRKEHTATALRRYAACSAEASVARRLLALALILDSHKPSVPMTMRHSPPGSLALRVLKDDLAHAHGSDPD